VSFATINLYVASERVTQRASL